MSVKLVNLMRRKQVFHLDHPDFHRAVYGFHRQIVRTRELNARNGDVGVRETSKAMPGTLTLLAGQTVEGLPDAIAQVPDVRAALRARRVRIETMPAEPAAEPTKPSTEKTETDKNPRRGRRAAETE